MKKQPNSSNLLNQDIISEMPQFEKALTSTELKEQYPSDKFLYLTSVDCLRFKVDIQKAIITEQDEAKKQEISKSLSQLDGLQKKRVRTELGEFTVFLKAIEVKEEKQEDTLEKAFDSFEYDSQFKFNKTGKEIKDKLALLKGKVEGKITSIQTNLTSSLESIGLVPTQSLSDYEVRGVEDETASIKQFPYEMTYNTDKSNESTSLPSYTGKSIAIPSVEKSTMCREYNRNIDCLVRAMKDIKKIGTFERNIEDKKTYTLSSQQLLELGF
jgi:hypothetical protein